MLIRRLRSPCILQIRREMRKILRGLTMPTGRPIQPSRHKIPPPLFLSRCLSHKTSDARKLFDAAVDEEEKARLFEEYRDAKDERNRFSWYTATVVFLSMFDAFVDAHLAGFPKCDEKLSIDMSSEEYRDLSVNLSYKF